MSKKIVITSGFFNPIHAGHINLIREAKQLGDYLVVIVNNDSQVKLKGSTEFMTENERVQIIKALEYVDDVFLAVDKDQYVPESLRVIANNYPGCELFFAKGGDRHIGNLPESEKKVCQDFNIKIISGVGGDKIQSSSWLLKKSKKQS